MNKLTLITFLLFVITSCQVQEEPEETPVDSPWTRKSDMFSARSNASCSVVGDKIYVIGGFFTSINNTYSSKLSMVEIYDPKEDSWTTGTPMSIARSTHGYAVVGTKIYVFGGTQGEGRGKTVEVYETTTDTWTRLNDMAVSRIGLRAEAIGNRIFLMGGHEFTFPNKTEEYSIDSDSLTSRSNMNVERVVFSSSVIDGKIYVIGSRRFSEPDVEVYDPVADSWTIITAPPVRLFSVATASLNGLLYSFGGIDLSRPNNNVLSYNPTTNKWKIRTGMPVKQNSMCAVSFKGKVYVIGGDNNIYGEYFSTVYEYDPSKEKLTD
jgi:N-acetylneuraminic acid mutarotase